jgi:protocatechuate 3,4-dioxygenase beta subunit
MFCRLLSLLLAVGAELPTSKDVQPIPVAGEVKDDQGKPAPGAEVWLARAAGWDDEERFGMALYWESRIAPDDDRPRVLAHATAGDDGRFTLTVPAEIVARPSPVLLAVWAVVINEGKPRLTVSRPMPWIPVGSINSEALTILGPDHKPLAEVKVAPARVRTLPKVWIDEKPWPLPLTPVLLNEPIPVPDALAERFAGTADDRGRVVLSGVEPGALGAVRVESPATGVQEIRLPDPKTREIIAAPVGRVRGQLKAVGAASLEGVRVRARSKAGGYSGSGIEGTAEAVCDASGRFEMPALAAGVVTLSLHFDPNGGTTQRGLAPERLIVEPGATAEVAISLQETVRVHGSVRERGTNRPIAGVKVALNGYFGGDSYAISDAEGKFSGRIPGSVNQPYGWAVEIPRPFYHPSNQSEPPQGMPPTGTAELALPPMELPRGVDVPGTVLDEEGKPVAGARIRALWNLDDIPQAALALSDEKGRFTLIGIDPLAELHVNAWSRGAATPEAVVLRAEKANSGPITVKVSKGAVGSTSGRVLDPAGKPVAGARVRIWQQLQNKADRLVHQFPATDWIFTDAEGRYQAWRLPLGKEYMVEANAPGRLAARSIATVLSKEGATLPELRLAGLRTVDGEVVDHDGKPVAGATVRQSGDGPMPTEATTDERGRFALPGLVEGPAFVLASKEGYRLKAQPIEAATSTVHMILTRRDQPPEIAYKTLPPPLPADQEKALALRLFTPYAEKVLASGKADQKYRMLAEACQIDPLAVLDRLESIAKIVPPDYLNIGRTFLVQGLARESLDEALAQAEACPDADTRTSAYLAIIEALPRLEPARLRELLDQATVNARGMKDPSQRGVMLSQVAAKRLDLGERDAAGKLIREAVESMKQASRGKKQGDLYLGFVAAPLGRLDLPAALKLVEEVAVAMRREGKGREYLFSRYYGKMAYGLAAESPADAEKALEHLPIHDREAPRHILATCSRMGTKDPARARRLAETMFVSEWAEYRPYSLGLIAQSMAATDRAGAEKLLDQAYAELSRLRAAGTSLVRNDPAILAAGLLPSAERVAPERLPEFIARTVALRPPRGEAEDGLQSAQTASSVAAMIARYDRTLAARLLEPELSQPGNRLGLFAGDYVTWHVLAALSLIDPARAVALVEQMPENPASATDPNSTRNMALTNVARLLTLHGEDRWTYVFEHLMYLWSPEQRSL